MDFTEATQYVEICMIQARECVTKQLYADARKWLEQAERHLETAVEQCVAPNDQAHADTDLLDELEAEFTAKDPGFLAAYEAAKARRKLRRGKTR